MIRTSIAFQFEHCFEIKGAYYMIPIRLVKLLRRAIALSKNTPLKKNRVKLPKLKQASQNVGASTSNIPLNLV